MASSFPDARSTEPSKTKRWLTAPAAVTPAHMLLCRASHLSTGLLCGAEQCSSSSGGLQHLRTAVPWRGSWCSQGLPPPSAVPHYRGFLRGFPWRYCFWFLKSFIFQIREIKISAFNEYACIAEGTHLRRRCQLLFFITACIKQSTLNFMFNGSLNNSAVVTSICLYYFHYSECLNIVVFF